MKKGFTLVELAIVLIVIGLLIGGILAAQSMIHTTKILNLIRQLQQYDIAATNFQTKYNQLPGDSTLFQPNGNNNGQIQGWGGGYIESDNFFSQLSQGVGLKAKDGNDYLPNNGTNCPKLEFQNLATGPSSNYTLTGDKSCLSVISLSPTGTAKNYYFPYCCAGGQMSDLNIQTIDTKIDDGNRSTGKVVSILMVGVPYPDYRSSVAVELGTSNATTN